MLVLAVVVFGAVWCVDGCPDPTDRNSPLRSSGVYTCTICVMPFATVPRFSLPEQGVEFRRIADVTVVHLWLAPTVSIDHPPRPI
jgi:hypothetical protein